MSDKSEITLRQKIGLVVFSTFLTLGMVALAGRFIKIGGESLNRKLVMKAWMLRKEWFGQPKIGITAADPEFGFCHKPLAKGKHFEPFSFRVRYHTDERGNRVTPGSYDQPKILFLGCSFTFGHGVEDNETYVSLLAQKLPAFKMVNGAEMAWGTVQAWLKLKKELAETGNVRGVVYGFIGHHQNRNYLRKSWLEMLAQYGRQNPHLEVEQGKIVRHGLTDLEKDRLTDDNLLAVKEKELTLALISDMKAECASRRIPLLVVYLPDNGLYDLSREIADLVGKEYFLDLRPGIDYASIQFETDGHPTPEGHRRIAGSILPFLKNILEKVPPLPSSDTLQVLNPH